MRISWRFLWLSCLVLGACVGSSRPVADGGDAAGDEATTGEGGGDGADTEAPDGADGDTDGDSIPDDVEGPGDDDGDTLPDYLDDDSDGDTIPDADEAGDGDPVTPPRDTDADTIPDYLDDDSDGDTIPDADEAGDDDPSTPPRDTDADTIPDYLDDDSDGDGADDFRERFHPGGDPLDPGLAPPDDDFVLLLPPGGPLIRDVLRFQTEIAIADVFFLVDTTGSMGSEIDHIQRTLVSTIIPGIRGRIPDTAIGVGHFDDFPIEPYGTSPDVPFRLLQAMTTDEALAQAGVGRLPLHGGADGPESQVEALYQTVTGEGFDPWVPAGSDPLCTGAPCFREGALPIVLLFTDAPFHNGPPGSAGDDYAGITPRPHTWAETVAALEAHNALVLGLCSAGPAETNPYWEQTRRDLEAAARATGAVDTAGVPLVLDIGLNGEGLTAGVIDIIEWLVGRVPIDVDAIVLDDQGDALGVDAACFVRELRPLRWISSDGVENDPAACRAIDDSMFYEVLPGTLVEFSVAFRNDGCFAGDDRYRTFLAWIIVRGNHVTYLDRHLVVVVVPPVAS